MSAARRKEARLEVPCETYFLASIRQVVRAMARQAGFSEAAVAQIQLAVDEVCAAAATQVRDSAEEARTLRVTVETDPRKLVATISDRAGGVGLRIQGAPVGFESHYDPATSSAMGSVIVSSTMDEVELREHEGVSEVRLIRYRETPARTHD